MAKVTLRPKLIATALIIVSVAILAGGIMAPKLRQGYLARTIHDWGEAVGALAGCWQCGQNYLSFDTSGNLYTTSVSSGGAPLSGLNVWDAMSQNGLPAGTIAVTSTCYLIKSTSGTINGLWVAGSSSAVTFTVQIFDTASVGDGSLGATGCKTAGTDSTNYMIYESGTTVGAGQVINLGVKTVNGIAVAVTGTMTKTTPIFIGWQ